METIRACIDWVPSWSVLALSEAKLYAHNTTAPFSLSPSPQPFMFANDLNRSLEMLSVSISVPDGSSLQTRLNVADDPASLFLEQSVREDHHFILDMMRRPVRSHNNKRTLRLCLLHDCLFLQWNAAKPYSTLHSTFSAIMESGLRRKMHVNFYHSTKPKLLNLVQRASFKKAFVETKKNSRSYS